MWGKTERIKRREAAKGLSHRKERYADLHDTLAMEKTWPRSCQRHCLSTDKVHCVTVRFHEGRVSFLEIHNSSEGIWETAEGLNALNSRPLNTVQHSCFCGRSLALPAQPVKQQVVIIKAHRSS